ncbi:MAG: Pantoate kinase [Promethearchaeota archaeon]|jgi:pantoate kinase|nr:MAG: Pantoate kinase [Candidatus Lokiarchaeota archaeon]
MSERKKIIIKVPHRITGFFEILDTKNGIKLENPEKIGSRGAGFTLSAMGTTKIISERIGKKNRDPSSCEIYINGSQVNKEAETTYYIFDYLKSFLPKPYFIKIVHNFDLPVGCGYGASGSGALGTIYGLNHLFGLKLSDFECGRIAHIAEVINKTGLGTVCGQLSAGLGIVAAPGYPCKYEYIKFPKNIHVICTSFGEISTKEFLSNQSLHAIVNEPGREALRKLKIDPDIKNFMRLSWNFVKETKILEILHLFKIRDLLEDLNKKQIIGASLNQLGKSIFAICKKKRVDEIKEILESYQTVNKIYCLKIEEKGLRIL